MMIEISREWHDLAQMLQGERPGIMVYVLGSVDTGKTTLCRFLIEELRKVFRTAYVDCDPGQSIVGPPVTLGLRIYLHDDDSQSFDRLMFLGALSPQGQSTYMIPMIKKLAEQAVFDGGKRIVVDSSGFVLGEPAVEFQSQLLDVLQPNWLVSIQKSEELEGLLERFDDHPKIKIMRLKVSAKVCRRTPFQRQRYREQKFKEYFEHAVLQRISFQEKKVSGRILDSKDPLMGLNLLVALCDEVDFVVALGILESIDRRKKVLEVVAPRIDSGLVASIRIGSLYLEKNGFHQQA